MVAPDVYFSDVVELIADVENLRRILVLFALVMETVNYFVEHFLVIGYYLQIPVFWLFIVFEAAIFSTVNVG